MDITTVDAAHKLHLETQRIKAALASAEAALQAARAAAAVPKPTVQPIGPGELEQARLSDLAGQTEGKLSKLEATKAADAQALVDWAAANAASVAEVARQEAAVKFHAGSLKEARRLELIAMSTAAAALRDHAASAYVAAFNALQVAGAELAALNMIAGGAGRQRVREGSRLEPMSPLELQVGPVEVPALEALNAYGQPREPGNDSVNQVRVQSDAMRRAAYRRAEEIMNAMKGRTQ